MDSPYINTKLYANVTLFPNQMNNNIYLNLKKNLIENVHKKNYGNYGYIIEVFEILSYNENKIEAENTMASAIYDVQFSCRLCKPLKDTKIICQVDRLNKVLLRLKNGPLYVIITNDRINESIFFKDNYRNLRYKIDEKSNVLMPGDFVKVSIVQLSFNAGDGNITGIGFLENMATDEEINSFYKEEYNNSDEFINYEEYIKNKQKKDEDNEYQEDSSDEDDNTKNTHTKNHQSGNLDQDDSKSGEIEQD